jgi:hypothetical protein
MSEPAAVFAIYRFRPDVDDSKVADLLRRHRAVLRNSGFVTEKLPTVVRSLQGEGGHRDFIEIFEWKDETAPGAAHSDPGVRQIWSEFETLTSAPAVALAQLAEATRPFAHFAPFTIEYETEQSTAPATAAPKKKPARARAKVAAKRPLSKPKAKVKVNVKTKRPAPKAAKSRGRRRATAKR